MPDREIQAISDNLLEAMCFFGRARADATVQRLPGVCLISCGMNYAAFNAAVLSDAVGHDANELRRRIEDAAEYYKSRALRWTYWLCDDLVDPSLRKESRALFNRAGLIPLTDPPGMYADGLRPPKRPLPAIELRPVCDEPARQAFAQITSLVFEIPHNICREIYGAERAWSGSFEGYVGYVGAVAVCTTAIVVKGGLAGVYSVGTLPGWRRRGYAEAIMREALCATRERTGIQATVLQSTASGISLYERMGYRKLTRFTVYIS